MLHFENFRNFFFKNHFHFLVFLVSNLNTSKNISKPSHRNEKAYTRKNISDFQKNKKISNKLSNKISNFGLNFCSPNKKHIKFQFRQILHSFYRFKRLSICFPQFDAFREKTTALFESSKKGIHTLRICAVHCF